MYKCNKCFTQIEVNAKFCNNCGDKLIEQSIDNTDVRNKSISTPIIETEESLQSECASSQEPQVDKSELLVKEGPSDIYRFIRFLFFLALGTLYFLFMETRNKTYTMIELFSSDPVMQISGGLGVIAPFYILIYCTRFVQKKRGNPPASALKICLLFLGFLTMIGFVIAILFSK